MSAQHSCISQERCGHTHSHRFSNTWRTYLRISDHFFRKKLSNLFFQICQCSKVIIPFLGTSPTDTQSQKSLYRCFSSDELHLPVPQVQTFPTKNRLVIYTGANYPDSLYIPVGRRKVLFGQLLPKNIMEETLEMLTSSGLGSSVHYTSRLYVIGINEAIRTFFSCILAATPGIHTVLSSV